jgi:REP element-mobilizing transposase RayT
VYARAVARGPLFRDDHDFRRYLAGLADICAACDWSCHTYCLMTTHVHLLMRTPDGDLSRGMQTLNSSYAAFYNERYRGLGHVFARRYEALLVESDGHLLELCRYIPLNPVRAGICAHPAQWRWSSYRQLAGLDPVQPWLAAGWLWAHFSPDPVRARERFRAFVAEALVG